ncbi:MAG: 3-dehydroquinate synthase [Sedimentisphaerales bacterium]|nr:3-dehydroquinate synthase [Sedimentisphaerales bacterium]
MKQLTVSIPATEPSGYPIFIANGLLEQIGSDLEQRCPGRKKFIVTDTHLVRAGHLTALTAGRDVSTFIIDPPGEPSKHIGTVVRIVEAMENAFLGRDTVIVALGGGTVGDIAGFAAAIFKRGVKVVQIPTTTVAQADSAVGGKTGVDSSVSKNAFGAFWQPEAVYIDPSTLNTLDDLQYRSGLVESIKHGLILDGGYFEFLERNMESILSRDTRVLETIAFENCRIKASVVQEDPTEKNKRRILNYGHTIGHAVESASQYKLLHGQAVAVGIVAAGLIEQALGLSDAARHKRIVAILEKLGMPLSISSEYSIDQLAAILKRDKKAVGQWPKFVLLEEIGKALCRNGQWAHDVSQTIVEQTLERLYG